MNVKTGIALHLICDAAQSCDGNTLPSLIMDSIDKLVVYLLNAAARLSAERSYNCPTGQQPVAVESRLYLFISRPLTQRESALCLVPRV